MQIGSFVSSFFTQKEDCLGISNSEDWLDITTHYTTIIIKTIIETLTDRRHWVYTKKWYNKDFKTLKK